MPGETGFNELPSSGLIFRNVSLPAPGFAHRFLADRLRVQSPGEQAGEKKHCFIIHPALNPSPASLNAKDSRSSKLLNVMRHGSSGNPEVFPDIADALPDLLIICTRGSGRTPRDQAQKDGQPIGGGQGFEHLCKSFQLIR